MVENSLSAIRKNNLMISVTANKYKYLAGNKPERYI